MINEDEIKPTPLQSFVDGLYCAKCDIGFIPDSKLKNSKSDEQIE